MNEVLDYLLLVAILGLGTIWATAAFCFILYTLGVDNER